MAKVNTNGIQIEYDTFGNRSCPALLLIGGNGAQTIFWDAEFCELLVNKGYFVIRFDNRDSGLSTKFEEAGIPDFPGAIRAVMEGRHAESAYYLEDMADDAAGLLEALAIEKAHICGASMGGMIAQIVAYRHPSHVLSLTSIMSGTGNPNLPQGKPDALALVISPPPAQRKEYIEHNMNVWRKIWSPGFPFNDQRARLYLEKSYDRSFCPQGMARQNMAILVKGDRSALLSTIRVPTLVIHGSDDPLIPVECGKDTAKLIPGARLLIINGMGHDMPKEVWKEIAEAISINSMQAENSMQAKA